MHPTSRPSGGMAVKMVTEFAGERPMRIDVVFPRAPRHVGASPMAGRRALDTRGSSNAHRHAPRPLSTPGRFPIMQRSVRAQQAVSNVNTLIAPTLKGMDVTKQQHIDKLMVEILDGPRNRR